MAVAMLGTGVPAFAADQSPTTMKPEAAMSSPITVTQSFGNWSYRCVYMGQPTAVPPSACLVEQALTAKVQGHAVQLATIILGKAERSTKVSMSAAPFRLTLVTPLGFSLAKPASLAVDKGAAVPFVYQTCTADGCLSTGTIPVSLLTALKHGSTGHLAIGKLAGGTITINFSLSGLGDALEAVDAASLRKTPT
jgi:invasion protein IalB